MQTPNPRSFAEQLHRVMRDAFTRESLERMLKFRLGQRLDWITPAGSEFDTVVFRLVLWADQNGRVLDLARAVAAERQGRPDAEKLLGEIEAAAASTSSLHEELQPVGPEDVPDAVGALARAYERIKRVMPEGDQRTVLMEEMVRKMRALQMANFHLPDRFHLSPSDGERLAATVALQRQPDPRYLRWLSERILVERAFIGYQSSMALRESAMTLPEGCLDAVEIAAQDALSWVESVPDPGGRRDLLHQAMKLVTTCTTQS